MSLRGRLRMIPLALCALVLPAAILIGQSPADLTWPGPNEEDEQPEVDPDAVVYTPTLGEPIEPAFEDPALFPPARHGRGSKAIVPIGLAPLDGSISEASFAPSKHYLNYQGTPIVLVGVSADNACHFNVTGTGQCNYSTYTTYLNDLAAQGLNKTRLWVSIVGGPGDTATCKGSTSGWVNDNPFAYNGTFPAADGIGRWYLDSKNANYFTRLSNVVSYANSKNIIVEVTLFSPLTGHLGLGPWSKAHAWRSNNTQLPGFSDTASFTNAAAAEYTAMKPYISNVIRFGYKCNTTDYTETRRQMGVLRRLLDKLFVYLGAQASSQTFPSWVNPGPYGAQEGTNLFKFWAALEPFGTFTDPRWLLYIHHSGRRNLPFDGYQAVVTSGGYREQGLRVCLGSAAGNYKVRWLDPKNAVDAAGNYTPLRTDTLNWPGATSCTPGGAGSVALQQSPAYNYDLAVLITL